MPTVSRPGKRGLSVSSACRQEDAHNASVNSLNTYCMFCLLQGADYIWMIHP
jgi:hypothetical protein